MRFLVVLLLFLLFAPAASPMRWLEADTTPPVITVPGDITAEATGPSGAAVGFTVDFSDPDDPIATSGCSRASGDTYSLGTTTVTCDATDSNGNPAPQGSFNITVQDMTGPTLVNVPGSITADATSASGEAVTYTDPTASDLVDGPRPVTCSPASGTTFAPGTTTVNCTTTDAAGNSSAAGFTVTVNPFDTTPPTINVPANVVAQATGPGGADVGYLVTFSDPDDPVASSGCSPGAGSTFPLGATTVSCTATDSKGNNAGQSFTVTVEDTSGPTIADVPGSMSLDATSSAGASVSYGSPTANDAVDGARPVNCVPASGSIFPVGTTTVNCSASDSRNNASSASFSVSVNADTTAPALTAVPGDIIREANGPAGSVATYALPSATDNLDVGPLLVTCLPASGSTFALGTATVGCGAVDSAGNTGAATFTVTVTDTTKPVLTVPADRSVYATSEGGIASSDPAVSAFLGGATASDIVDKTLAIANDAPASLPVGTTTVTFTVTDDAGNTATASAKLMVLPKPSEGTTPAPLPSAPDRTPPDDVRGLKAVAASGKVTLTWGKPLAGDFDHVVVTRSVSGGGADVTVYTGRNTTLIDSKVVNGTEYRYTVVSFDTAGNRSAGAVVVASPSTPLLLTPPDGARFKAPQRLLLSWVSIPGARYYNAQVYLGDQKVLSIWPVKPRALLTRTWKFAGKRHRLAPGLYRWYVWPGEGARKDTRYGQLLGSGSFEVVR
jgi:HYR domain-containing protein